MSIVWRGCFHLDGRPRPPDNAAAHHDRGVPMYDAFISYSHAADGKLAPALQQGLQGFAKPWYRRRALRVFRDQTSLAATPELWPTIQSALDEATHFLLLASPEAAQSRWVRREVAHWLAVKPPGGLFIVLTGGELVWDE